MPVNKVRIVQNDNRARQYSYYAKQSEQDSLLKHQENYFLKSLLLYLHDGHYTSHCCLRTLIEQT